MKKNAGLETYPQGVVLKERDNNGEVAEFQESSLVRMDLKSSVKDKDDNGEMIRLRIGGDFEYKALVLDANYIWEIVIDGDGFVLLVPTK
jgi:hypothetical protein